MNEAELTHYITRTFDRVSVTEDSGNRFFFWGPDLRMPFATLVTNDAYDRASALDRPGVFRLNLGVRRQTYRSLFGPQPKAAGPDGVVDTGYDYTALDRLMPHPVYAPMSWVCVLNPGPATFEVLRPLLAEACDLAARRAARRADRTGQR
ncbi:hypothetical protein HNR42_002811 [Deinobacterium chartae]|uniref:DUF6194 domain-containing protein n=1 Tax=Deinobacterium chartae TaxID=521158 RepID=A0A841I4M7_9DEIO|nr:DUF6194 family protein [Deinobacterium chartae]MBB6099370.1 hypothetical protein [Deinobacterium chartae]